MTVILARIAALSLVMGAAACAPATSTVESPVQAATRSSETRAFLAQISRGTADTVGISVHLSGLAVPVTSGASGTPAHCQSTGRGEAEFLDDVLGRLGRIRT